MNRICYQRDNEYHASFAEERRKQAEEEEAVKHTAWERYLEDLRQVAHFMNTTSTFQAEVDARHGRVIIKRIECPEEEWLEVTKYCDHYPPREDI